MWHPLTGPLGSRHHHSSSPEGDTSPPHSVLQSQKLQVELTSHTQSICSGPHLKWHGYGGFYPPDSVMNLPSMWQGTAVLPLYNKEAMNS